MDHNPVQESELDRILALSTLDIDYFEPNQGLDFLTELAAKIAGTQISMVNLIDTFNQWSVSSFGIDVSQLPREDSVCQYTILEKQGGEFLVPDLSKDDRFSDKFYVAGDPNIRFYMGVPLTTPEGYNLGALCVMDSNLVQLSDETKDIFKLIGRQVVDRLMANNLVSRLKNQLIKSETTQKKLAHDFRGPVGGIIGLSDLILDEDDEIEMEEIFEYVTLIKESGNSLIDLSNDILQKDFNKFSQHFSSLKEGETNLVIIKERIIQLLAPQIKVKNLSFTFTIGELDRHLPFQKIYILQILGNLLSNSIKFTQPNGSIEAIISLDHRREELWLVMIVRDNGIGISPEKISEIMKEGTRTNTGTQGEIGFGLGLNLVKQLVYQRSGTMTVSSTPNEMTEFKITIQVN